MALPRPDRHPRPAAAIDRRRRARAPRPSCTGDQLRRALLPLDPGRRPAARSADCVRAVPPSGHVAGMFARVDRRRGVHKPPANEVLEGAFDLHRPRSTTRRTASSTTPRQRHPAVPGPRHPGARRPHARSATSRWRYVNVRRLFAMIEEALDEQMQWARRSSRTTRLWREIDRAVRGFLERLYGAGMLDGATAEEAYFVRCDATTNPPAQTDARPRDLRRSASSRRSRPSSWSCASASTRSGIQIEETGGARMSETGARLRSVPGVPLRGRPSTTCRRAASATAPACSRRPRCRSTPRAGSTRTPGSFPARTKQSNVTLKRGIVDQGALGLVPTPSPPATSGRATASILVHDPSGSDDRRRVPARRRLPGEVDRARSCRPAQNNLAVETLELAHQGLTRQEVSRCRCTSSG